MRFVIFISALFAALFTGLAATPPAKAEDMIPVWISPQLSAETIDDVHDLRLKDREYPVLAKSHPKGPVERAKPANCVELETYARKGFIQERPPDVYHLQLHHCYALKRLGRAKPSRRSFVQSFTLDPDAVDFLPVMIEFIGPREDTCDAVKANHFKIPLSSAYNVEQATVTESPHDARTLTIVTKNWDRRSEFPFWHGTWATLWIMAKADFNGDGVEDILLTGTGNNVDWFIDEDGRVLEDHASAVDRMSMILTRFSGSGVLQIIEGWSLPLVTPEPDILAQCDRDLKSLYRQMGR